ncbi:CO dehydrogenase/acetyl-CoA synthase epsilon subunit [Croceifilum oryzae]|uniref:CO dehydrogenase/acetyl-CoA synthase epsilon subunit n=1 Tax=Croceifilum oryzae TaxID=1553429 RepID=A0AAJ1THJ6_9BACL|nr:hypothetical protein [Croceifilum oryzae]MDQ0417112.1 CO dehydrogenase/acetyl-CoA synthase epsilon subunit [Croceifilum oryzae]
MNKTVSILSVCAISAVTAFAVGVGSASASVPRYSFQTEDGKWDGFIGNENNGSSIQIELVKPLYSKTGSGIKKFTDYSKLWVRLCNEKTKACTTFHNLSSGESTFTNMKTGRYNVDIKDELSSASIFGQLDIIFP